MARVFSDLKLVLRQLRKSPGFTSTAVLILAFGIGATTTIFSIVEGVLLRPLPFPDPSRLVTLGDQVSGTDWGRRDAGPVTAPEVVIYPRDMRSFQSLGGYGGTGFELSGRGQPAQIIATRMSPAVFSALGVAPLMGRVFTPQEDEQKQQVAVLSYATWKDRFSGDPKVLGTRIELDRKTYEVIGVMPRNFEFPLIRGRLSRCELWVPMSLSAQELTPEAFGSWYLNLVGRLKPGITAAQAEDDAGRVAAQIMRSYPPDLSNFHIRPVVYPLQQITVEQTRPLLRVLFLAVTVVLLIACFNLAGLLLVRAIRRQRETAVRLAIGAPALTLLGQNMLESLIIALTGGLLGIGLAALALAIGKNLLPETLPLVNGIRLDGAVIGFALLLALITGALCGLVPGLAALRTNVNAAIKDGGRSGSLGSSHARLRSSLVVTEIAIALVLLTASGLLLRSFSNMDAVDLGFRPDHVVTGVYALPEKQYSTQALVDEFNLKLLAELRQQPGVGSVGLTSTLPMTGDGIVTFVVDGYVDPRGPDLTVASPSEVIGDYFKAMGIALIRGRFFSEDDNANHQLAVIVNRRFAMHYWPNQDPIGKRLRLGTQKTATPWMTVVGEVADAKLNSPDADDAEQFYQPVAQIEKDLGSFAAPTDLNGNGNYVVIRSALPPEQMENIFRASVRSIDARLPLTEVRSMDEVVSQSGASRRFNTVVISCFALAAVLLAILGIYSVISFSVASRVEEMAIRMALGSPRSHIIRLVLVYGLKLAAIGCALGLVGSAVASTILRSFLFHVSPFDPFVMILASIAVFCLALVASTFPARRAASVNPVKALRGQ
jgi:predicted permease